MKFPKRFEMEGIDPMTVPVKVVDKSGVTMYKDMEEFRFFLGQLIDRLAGPFADQYNGEWVVRFESWEVYKRLSA